MCANYKYHYVHLKQQRWPEVGAHITQTPPGWSGPERAELAWSQPLQLAPARPGSFSAKSVWSVESALSHWSQLLKLESAWSSAVRTNLAGSP